MLIGLEQLGRLRRLTAELASKRVGLLAHPASVDRGLRHVSEILPEHAIHPRVIFGPEHGYGGEAQDMIGVSDARSPDGVPVISLYGDSLEALSPQPEQLAELDVLLIDLADVGSRYYTFIWTALLAVIAAAKASVDTVLLDRPNPLGGLFSQTEGALQQDGFLSFVGLRKTPVRHGLTVGEIVMLFAQEAGVAERLRVVPLRGWERARLATGWDRPFVLTSPNMPTFETALVYPGGCLIEGTNLSEGRGTTRPFEIVGAPFIDGRRLARELAATGLPGFVARPSSFRPTFQKHQGKECGGVQIHVTNAATFRPYATYLALVALSKRQAPQDFRFRTERYEFVDDIPAFDLLTGSSVCREKIQAEAEISDLLHEASLVDQGWKNRMEEAQSLVQERAVRE